MRRMQRIVLLATFVAAMPVLSGCANFDPDSLDVFGLSEKKKLPGDRKPVFPEGVPGVTQGVPPQYMKGSQPTDGLQGADQVAPPPAAAPAEEAKPEPAVKPKPKRKVAAKPKPKPAAAPTAQEQQAPAQQPQGQQAQAPSAWPQGSTPPSGGAAAWPAPPPTGTFSR